MVRLFFGTLNFHIWSLAGTSLVLHLSIPCKKCVLWRLRTLHATTCERCGTDFGIGDNMWTSVSCIPNTKWLKILHTLYPVHTRYLHTQWLWMRTQPQGWHQDDWTGVLKWQVRNRMISKMAPTNLGKICLGTFLLSLLARSGKCFKLLPLVEEQAEKQEQNYDLHLPSLSHFVRKKPDNSCLWHPLFSAGDIFTSEEISRQAWTFPKLSRRRHNNKKIRAGSCSQI